MKTDVSVVSGKSETLVRLTTFNVNHNVRVKLTAAGYAHLKQVDQLWRLQPGYSNAVDDATGYSEWQLWDLIATFGPAVYMGGPVPFETEILLVPDPWRCKQAADGQ